MFLEIGEGVFGEAFAGKDKEHGFFDLLTCYPGKCGCSDTEIHQSTGPRVHHDIPRSLEEYRSPLTRADLFVLLVPVFELL